MYIVFFQVIGSLVLLGALIFLSYVTTRYVASKTNKTMKGKYINVIETVNLGVDKRIHLVKAGDEYVLIATSGKNVEYLTTVKLDSYEPGNIGNTGRVLENNAVLDFKNTLEKYISAFKSRKNAQKSRKSNEGNIPATMKGDTFKSNVNRLRTFNTKVTDPGKEDGDDTTDEK